MNKNTKIVAVLGCIILVFVVCFLVLERPTLVESLVTDNTINIFPEEIIYFEEFGESNFTCTGMTYDTIDEVFWIADYGTTERSGDEKEPRLVAVNFSRGEVVKEIPLADCVIKNSNVQGIAYDSTENIIWTVLGESIIAIDKNGNKKHEIENKSFYYGIANGIAYDEETNSLWVLCYRKYLYNISKDGELLKRFEVNLKEQDMIYIHNNQIWVTVGADYHGENNYIVGIDKTTGEMEVLYRLNMSYAVEGLIILDKNIYVCNDGYYHNSKINASYISKYSVSY